MINFRCTNCQQEMSVPESLAAQSDACPSCGHVCPVPIAGSPFRYRFIWPVVALVCASIVTLGLFFGLRDRGRPVESFPVRVQDSGPQQKRVQALIKELQSDRPGVRDAVTKELGEIGISAMPALIEAFRGAEPSIILAVAEAIGKIGPPAIPFLRKVLEAADEGQPGEGELPSMIMSAMTKEDDVRRGAVQALEEIGAPAIPTLIEALRSKDFGVSWGAAYSLGRIGESAVPALTDALGSDYPQVRRQAAMALTDMARGYVIRDPRKKDAARSALRTAIPSLIKALQDKDAKVSQNAAEALGEIGASADMAVPALVEALMYGNTADMKFPSRLRSDDGVREAAARALGNIGSAADKVVPALIDSLKDEQVRIQGASAEALGCFGPAAKAAVPTLKSIMDDRWKYSIRETVAEAIKKIEGQ